MKSKTLMLTGLAVGLTTFATSAFAQTAEGYAHHGQMWSGGSHHGFFGGPLMVLGAIVLIALIVMGVARMMGCRGRCGRHGSGASAIAILEERFAKGEIDKAEFEDRKSALKS